MNYESDIGRGHERHPEAFADADTLASFAAKIADSDPRLSRVLAFLAERSASRGDGYWERYFQSVQEHGFLSKALALPKARKLSDLFDGAGLGQYQTGARTRAQNITARQGGLFVSATRAPGFAYFGPLGASYYVRDGDIRGRKGGSMWLTLAQPGQALRDAWGPMESDDHEWGLSTIEANQWSDGRTLLVGRSNNGFANRWLALIDAGESFMDMLSEHERGEIAAEEARRDEVYNAAQPAA